MTNTTPPKINIKQHPSLLSLLLSNCSHEAVSHILQFLCDLPGRALQLVRDLLLLGRIEYVEALAAAETNGQKALLNDRKRKNKGEGGRGCIQVAVDDVFDRHIVGAVHEMIAADDAVSLLPYVPDNKSQGDDSCKTVRERERR